EAPRRSRSARALCAGKTPLLKKPDSFRSLQARALRRRHIPDTGILAQLKGADIGDDGPTIGGGYLAAIAGHHADTVRHHIKEVADGSRFQTRFVQRWRLFEPALHHHSPTVSGAA